MKEALQRPREARTLLADKLLESMDLDEPFEVSAEWREEIGRRCREIDERVVVLIPGEEVLKEAAEGLHE